MMFYWHISTSMMFINLSANSAISEPENEFLPRVGVSPTRETGRDLFTYYVSDIAVTF